MPDRPAPEDRFPSADERVAVFWVLLGSALVGVVWFLLFGAWVVNPEGSGYLSVAYNIRRGLGPVLPDGSTIGAWRGPAYSALLGLPWIGGTSLRASIWMSRLPLLLAPALVGAFVWRCTRDLVATAAGAAVALVQPWTLLAGGALFVPDGMSAVLSVAAIAAATVGNFSLHIRNVDRDRARSPVVRGTQWYVAAGFAALAAAATREAGIVAFALALLAAWAGIRRARRTTRIASLLLLGLGVFVALVIADGGLDVGPLHIPSAFVGRFLDDGYGNPIVGLALIVVVGTLIAWSVTRVTEPLVYGGLLLVVTGLAVGAYAAGRNWGIRDAAWLPYGVAILAGAAVNARAELVAFGRRVAPALVVALLVLGLVGSIHVENGVGKQVDWDNGASREVGTWLADHASNSRVACAYVFCSYVWLENEAAFEARLMPQFAARRGPSRLERLEFDNRSDWISPMPVASVRDGVPLVLTRDGDTYGAIFETPLLDELREERARYLVVSGNLDDPGTFDAGHLLPYLEANTSFRRVFASSPRHLPAYAVVYEVVGEVSPAPAPVATTPREFRRDLRRILHGRRLERGAPEST